MLIVPVVEGLDWRRPPPVTVLLILVNCLVFFLYQTGDTARERTAFDAYFSSSLPALELPAYKARLRDTQPKLAAQVDRVDSRLLARHMSNDAAFVADLHAGRIVAADNPRYAQWKEDRARFEALEARVSYRRFGFVPADARPLTWVTSMFLHGDLMHLLGNMVFLFIVGVAVESALGGFWYLLLYLAGGLAGDALHWIVHPASVMPTVGASGAISGLMGLFTVVFGLRKVNFFYWLVFVFGFRTMRGIVVLPVWIAWEVLQFFMDKASRVAYMEHAGGLIGGAVFGLIVMKRFAGTRVERFHGEREQEAFDQAEYDKARGLVAKLDFKGASVVFARLARRFPGHGELLRQWHAIAKADPMSDAYHEVAGRILALPKGDATQRREIFDEYFAKAGTARRLDPVGLATAGLAFARAGDLARAERAAEALLKLAPGEPRLPVLWEALAHGLERNALDEASVKKARRYRALVGAQAKARAASKAAGPA